MACPMRIGGKTQIAQASYVTEAQKRPQQEQGSEQDGAVKKRIEIIFRQKREHAVRCERLCRPEKNRSKQRSCDDDRDKIDC